MTIEAIIRGESKNTEFKEMLPAVSEKFVKTVIAFANTQGGTLIIGVADKTRVIVGVDDAELFKQMDSIANAVADSCEPQIVPEIEPHTVNGKTVIAVTVAPGPHRPYYLKAKGKEKGVFIRAAGTTRPASPEKIKELEMEGARISWDELVCVGYSVTEAAVKKLCRDMNRYRKEMRTRGLLPGKPPAVTRTNLEDWKLLKKNGAGYSASNAFVLLTSKHFPFSKTQCAVFKGIERTVFLDKREFSGPLYQQIEEAVNFVLRNIRLGAVIRGLVRREEYELPVDAIREMIVNAHCHRNFTDESCIQVAVYDDRLEVTSPGGLYNGLTFAEAMQGHSRLRNRAVAYVFNQMGLIEAWGTGIRRIQEAAGLFGLPDPEFIEMPDSFRVNLYRKPFCRTDVVGEIGDVGEIRSIEAAGGIEYVGEASDVYGAGCSGCVGDVGNEAGKASAFDDTLKHSILRMIAEDNRISAAKLALALPVTRRTVERYIKELREEGRLVRRGFARGGYWDII